jgi:hypothetical protein
VVAPRLSSEPRLTPGPPKRFAQGIGAALSTAALVVWLVAGWGAATGVLALLALGAFFESVFGYCLGCTVFARLMRAGVIPERVCEECADLSRHRSRLTPDSRTVA